MPLLVCPNCNVAMTQVKRSDVEIDMCPQCRGVWLDRGELEKLLQPLREQAEAPTQPPRAGDRNRQHRDHDDDHHGDRQDRRIDGQHGRRQGWRNILDTFE